MLFALDKTKAGVRWGLAALLLAGAWLFFWLQHPEWMSFQEQNQLFLWTTDYLVQRICVAGGVADWLGEFVVQFFYVEWLGALLMALLLVLMQQAALMALKSQPSNLISQISALLPPLFFLWLLGDENVLVALPMAVTLVLAAIALMRRTRWYWWLAIVPALWWSVGGPWTTFYRTPQQGPALDGWDKDKWELLKQDYLIRHERWDDIVERAKEHTVQTPFWSNSVNLALAMRGELADRQFDFWQSGEDALLMPMVRDNVSNLPTMEAFWRLGMVNSALRYASDLQESILNARKSGRLEQRIAECLLVNGRDTIAHKHLQLLKKSLFYRSWAEASEKLIVKSEKFATAPENNAEAKSSMFNVQSSMFNVQSSINQKRQLRYRENFLFSYPEIDKMLGILFQNNTQNKMALEYFLGQLLLKGDAQTFMQGLQWSQQYGGYRVMPMVYQDAVQCIQSPSLGDSPYGKYVKRMMGGQQR